MRIFTNRYFFCVLMTGTLFGVARADIATTGYVHDFYQDTCNNSTLDIAGADGRQIASKSYTLGMVDTINQNKTTYRADMESDAIASAGYVQGTVDMVAGSSVCCVGGYYDVDLTECRACGTWSVAAAKECLDEGKYRNGDSCSNCPSGYVCPAGTSGKISNAVYVVQCLDEGEYRTKNTCQECVDGYVCPAGQNNAEDCGVGYWCVNSEATECDWGANQCPLLNHDVQPTTVACDNAFTFSN